MFKGTVSIISNYIPCKDANVRFTGYSGTLETLTCMKKGGR